MIVNLKRASFHLRGATTLGLMHSEGSDNGDQFIIFVDSKHAGDKAEEIRLWEP